MNEPNILLVEDTLESLQLLSDLLTEAGYQVRPAQNGELALASLAVRLPDLILLDIRMPGMDGFEVLRRLKAQDASRNIPVIILSAITETEQHVQGLQLGAVDFLTKPYRREELLAKVRTHLELVRVRKALERQTAELEIANRTLTIAKEAAEAASRAKTTFLANMSHELRTPMNGIMGMVDLALRRATDPKQIDWLNKSKGSAQHLLAIINDVLDFSKIEADRLTLEIVPFKFDAVLENLLSLLGHNAEEKQLKLVIDLEPGISRLSLLGDPIRLGQILLNLVGNAIKFTDHGSITVRARQLEDTTDDTLLHIEVADTGIGISADDQKRLFAAFEQADGSMTRKHGGTGLGLAISKRLAHMMGGDAGVVSQIDQGSTFWFTVRLGKAQDDNGAVPPALTSAQDSVMSN